MPRVHIPGLGTVNFPDGTSPEDMERLANNALMEKNTGQPATGPVPGGNTGVPAGLSGPQAPEYKPFGSSDEARDEATGLLKAGTSAVASPIAHMASHIPGAVGHVQAQSAKDFDEYAKPANRGEQFGKVSGTLGMALPAIATGGELAGGLFGELQPAYGAPVSSAIRSVAGPLGDVAWSGAKKLSTGALFGTGYELRHGIADKLKEFLK